MAKLAKRIAKAQEAFAGKANISVEDAVKLIKQWDKKAAAIGLGVLKDSYRVGSRRFIEKRQSRHTTAQPQCGFERFSQPLFEIAAYFEAIHDHFNTMLAAQI